MEEGENRFEMLHAHVHVIQPEGCTHGVGLYRTSPAKLRQVHSHARDRPLWIEANVRAERRCAQAIR